MENIADALKISFAVFIFVAAIAITFTLISKAKTTSDIVLYHTDKTNFYEKAESKDENRTVDLATVITTLYKASEESVNVKVIDINGDELCEFCATPEEDINKFINDNLDKLQPDGVQYKGYKEEFVEVPYSGIYKTGEDGTQITLSDGGKRVYITYYATKD